MAGQIYNYTVHSLPTSGKDALAKLRTFLIAQGWTSEDYRTSVDWGSDGSGGYQWNAGNDDFCQMFSNGYGHQSIRTRLYVEYDSTYTNQYKFYSSVLDPTDDGVLDFNSSVHPKDQGAWYDTQMHYLTVPSGTFNELYLFGNNKWFLIGFRCTATTFIQFNLGTPELYPEYRNTTELMMRFPGQNTNNVLYRWDALDNGSYAGHFFRPWAIKGVQNCHIMYYDGESQNYTKVNMNMTETNGSETGYWSRFRNVRRVNSWSGKRLMIRPDFFVKNSSDVWEPIGHHPAHALPVAGLRMAEIVKYGSEEYMTFPCPVYGEEDSFGIRIA